MTGFVRGRLVHHLISTLLAVAISGGVLWWLLGEHGLGLLVETVRRAAAGPLLLAGGLVFLIQYARAWRFALLLSGQLTLPSWAMMGIATRLVLFNFLLPFKLGELSFPLMMKQTFGTGYSRAAGVLIMSRLLDFGAVASLFLFCAALVLQPGQLGWSGPVLILAGAAALLAPLVAIDLLPLLRRLAIGWPRLRHLLEQVTEGAALLRPARQRALGMVITAMIWLAHGVIAWLAGQALGSALSYAHFAMAGAAANLAFALPVPSIAGVGPPQAAWAGSLHLAGVAWAEAIATAVACQAVLVAAVLALGALTLAASLRQWLRRDLPVGRGHGLPS